MLLNEINLSKKQNAVKALREHYELDLHLERLDRPATEKMLTRVRKLVSETRQSRDIHESHGNASYLKLVMMEQALSTHLADLKAGYKAARVVVESEEVEKSQVILAAQDMVDSVQKMIEQVSKMSAEELPAVVSGIENEIGVSEAGEFEAQAQEALNALQQALTTAKQGLKGAMGPVTGEASAEEAFGGEEEIGFDAELPDGEEIEGEEEVGGLDEPFGGADIGDEFPEEPEEAPVAGVGRNKR